MRNSILLVLLKNDLIEITRNDTIKSNILISIVGLIIGFFFMIMSFSMGVFCAFYTLENENLVNIISEHEQGISFFLLFDMFTILIFQKLSLSIYDVCMHLPINLNILVIGDVMIDAYTPSRPSMRSA